MRRTQTFLMMLTTISVLTPALARAQTEPTSTARFVSATSVHRGFGVGAVQLFIPAPLPVPNLLATWGDAGGRFHIDGLFGLAHQGNTNFDLGVRGWYHVHAAPSADLSLGAGFIYISRKQGNADRQSDFELELGSQVRVFIVPNVALLGSLGLGIYLPDSGDSTVALGGQIVGSLGLAYYFE
jgi:hypothetical protein